MSEKRGKGIVKRLNANYKDLWIQMTQKMSAKVKFTTTLDTERKKFWAMFLCPKHDYTIARDFIAQSEFINKVWYDSEVSDLLLSGQVPSMAANKLLHLALSSSEGRFVFTEVTRFSVEPIESDYKLDQARKHSNIVLMKEYTVSTDYFLWKQTC